MGENVKRPDSLTQLVAVFVGKTTLENGLAMPPEDEHLSISLCFTIQHSTPGCLPTEMSPNTHHIACLRVFRTALFQVAPKWKRPKSS